MAESCPVCIETYNRSNTKKILCNMCDYTACRTCVTQYMNSNVTTAHCMSCRATWNRSHIVANFTKDFVNTVYKTHRENVLLDRERGLLPATQPLAEKYLQVKNITSEISEIDGMVDALCAQSKAALDKSVVKTSIEGRMYLLEQDYKFQLEVAPHKCRISFLQSKRTLLQGSKNTEVVERRSFIKACPSSDCRGFLSSAWKCGLCELWTCPECHEIKGTERDGAHTCNPDVLATVKMMAEDTRQCPKCPALIFKIEGCDQMYCTQCHTAFSWRTGHVEIGTIHNPHYYEYMRQQNGGVAPRNHGDIPCGGLIRERTIGQIMRQSHISPNTEAYNILLDYHRIHAHIQNVELPKYVVNRNATNEDLRIKFLVHEIDEDAFKLQLQKREKGNEKKQEIHQILTMYQTVVMDIINRLDGFGGVITLAQLEAIIHELDTICLYTNTSFISISKLYSCVVPFMEYEIRNITSREHTDVLSVKTLQYRSTKY